MTIPIITVTGEPIPDRHAARVVVEMTRWLDDESKRMGEHVRAHRKMYECGSPKAQTRYADRMARAFGHRLIEQKLMTGKRGRYGIDTHIWSLAPPDFGRHCIAGVLLSIRSGGGTKRELVDGKWHKAQNRENCETPTFMVTGHALQRIAQRTGVKTPLDLLRSIRALGQAVLADEMRIVGGTLFDFLENRDRLLAGVQKVTFDGGVAVCRRDHDEDVPVVVTVLPL